MAHISNRLEVMEALGEGGYGLVHRVRDRPMSVCRKFVLGMCSELEHGIESDHFVFDSQDIRECPMPASSSSLRHHVPKPRGRASSQRTNIFAEARTLM